MPSQPAPGGGVLRRTQVERTALSDQRMIAAAVSLLLECGIAGTTLSKIGERAGYSRGLVTHRFGSKAGLLAQVHDTAVADWIARVHKAVGHRTGVRALQKLVDALHGFMVESPEEIRAMYLLRYASIDPAAEFRANVARAHKAQSRDVRRWIGQGIEAGEIDARVDAGLAAELFCSAVDGMIYRWLVNPQTPVGRLRQMLKNELQRSLAAARS